MSRRVITEPLIWIVGVYSIHAVMIGPGVTITNLYGDGDGLLDVAIL